ncbi:MAG TPA: hypothetical protein VF678_02900 [bacterium]
MKRILLAALLATAVTVAASNAFAVSYTLDVPTSYTLNDRTPNGQNNGPVKHQTLNDVDGFKLLVAGSHHLGVGYERYEVKGRGTGGGGPFDFTTTFQFYDVVLDMPTRLLNFGLGYGKGTVNTAVSTSGAPNISQADVSQWFGGVGIPFGEHFDIHVAYHQVTSEKQKVANVGSPDSLNLSGHTLMAGVRLAW